MKNCFISSLAGLAVAACVLVASGCNDVATTPQITASSTPASQQLPFSEGKPLVVPAKTPVYIRLRQRLSSATAQPGQTFSAVLDEPLRLNDQVVAPKGTPVTGKVVAVRESGHLHNSGYLRITLSSITLNGRTLPIETEGVSIHGGSFRNHNYAVVAGGPTRGALITGLGDQGKGATIASPFGAAGGPTAAYTNANKEVGFSAERRLGFRLTQPLNIS